MIDIQNAVMVVAHPDDEILWFSSILNDCKRVLVCFGTSATSKQSWDSGRAAMMETYPLPKVKFLKLSESDVFEAANWNKPKVADSGLHLRRQRKIRSLYDENAKNLLRILEMELKTESLVFTHNPWGEYGHEEHVQIFRVLAELRKKLNFDLFVDGYLSHRSAKLMEVSMPSLEGSPLVRETDKMLALELKNLYLENECWTWVPDYEWPERECFYRVAPLDVAIHTNNSASYPLNYITYNFDVNAVRRLARRMLSPSVRSRMKRASRILSTLFAR